MLEAQRQRGLEDALLEMHSKGSSDGCKVGTCVRASLCGERRTARHLACVARLGTMPVPQTYPPLLPPTATSHNAPPQAVRLEARQHCIEEDAPAAPASTSPPAPADMRALLAALKCAFAGERAHGFVPGKDQPEESMARLRPAVEGLLKVRGGASAVPCICNPRRRSWRRVFLGGCWMRASTAVLCGGASCLSPWGAGKPPRRQGAPPDAR